MAWLSEVKATEMSNSCLSSLDPTQTLTILPRAPGKLCGTEASTSNLSLLSLCSFHTQEQLSCRTLPYPYLSLCLCQPHLSGLALFFLYPVLLAVQSAPSAAGTFTGSSLPSQ